MRARISDTIVDQEQNLDAALVSVTGLADIGNDVIGTNRQPLADVLHLLVPTTDLLNKYNQALWCALSGMANVSQRPPLKEPGVVVLAGFLWGQERYRYPMDLPKAGATGGPQCTVCRTCRSKAVPPYVVADTGTNPWRRTYPGIVLNSDGLKKILFGDIDGPPRNTSSDRPTRMRRSLRPTLIKFGIFGIVMVLLTASLFFIFGQYQTGSTNDYSAVFNDASRLR